MDIIKLTRELGKAIQAEEKYKNIYQAVKANEADENLNRLVRRAQEIQMIYQSPENANKSREELSEYEKEFNELHGKIMQNENMKRYTEAQKEMDEMMNYIIQILVLCANGADPDTCEPKAQKE